MAVFDKIVVGINKGVTSVGANSKAMVEKAKVNSAINNAEAERTKLITLLGQKVYAVYKEKSDIAADVGINNFLAEISGRDEFIAQQKEELKLIDEKVNLAVNSVTPDYKGQAQGAAGCACGFANTAGAKFCAKCGTGIAQ